MAGNGAEEGEDRVRAALADAYGIDADLVRLPGENVNYRVTDASGHRYVAKLAGDQQPPAFVALEHAALTHAARADLGLRLPLITENRFGHQETLISISGDPPIRLRLIEFIDGIAWSELSDISNELRVDLGRTLAGFDRAMRDFDHPEAHRTHRWDLTRLDQHREKLRLIDDLAGRRLLSWAFEQWTNQASPDLRALEAQFIHGDPNPENILVAGDRVAGLIDFGDCCWNPPVCELAICLAYQMMGEDDPWAAADPIIAGWNEVRPMSTRERRILPALILGRLTNTLCVAAERATRDPGHPNWFVSVAPAWKLLHNLHGLSKQDV